MRIERKVRRPGSFFEEDPSVIKQPFDLFLSKDKRFKAYLQNELTPLSGGKFRESFCVVVKYPLKTNVETVNKWVSKADKRRNAFLS